MKIGGIWDYLMRRKALFGLLLAVLALSSFLGAKIIAAHRPISSQAQEIGVGPMPVYNNALILRIPNQAGQAAYELKFDADFKQAKVSVAAVDLEASAYVRILNANGQLVAGEYTTVQENASAATDAGQAVANVTHRFAQAPASYNVKLSPGYTIEISSKNTQVISTLNNSLATEFMPQDTTERYVVMSGGLRKAGWSDAQARTALSNLLKNHIINQIENYRRQLSDEVLNNRHLEVASKTQIVLAWRMLDFADRLPYHDFINNLRRGGVPQITYYGRRQYTVGETANFSDLVSAHDGEDGDYAIEEIVTRSEVDFGQAGEYLLAYTVRDSDQNTVTLKIPIAVVEPQAEQPAPGTFPPLENVTDSSLNEMEQISNPSTSAGQNTSAIGSGVNTDAAPTADTTSMVWDNTTSETVIAPAETNSDEETGPTVTVATPTRPDEAEADSEAATAKSGISASQIVLIVLGIVLFAGLVRFIFDHYVR